MKLVRTLVLLASLITCSVGFAKEEFTVYTTSVGNSEKIGENIIASTADHQNFFIQCSHSKVPGGSLIGFKSSAKFYFPNDKGDIVTHLGSIVARTTESESRDLNDEAVSEICNNPNGIYTLRIHDKVEFVSRQSGSTDSGQRDLGF